MKLCVFGVPLRESAYNCCFPATEREIGKFLSHLVWQKLQQRTVNQNTKRSNNAIYMSGRLDADL